MRRFLGLSLFFSMALLAGCGSDHENTVSPGPTYPIPRPPSADSALYWVVTGIATKNSTVYESVLPDTLLDSTQFHAFFDQQDLADYVQAGNTPPSDWTTSDEKTFISQFTTLAHVSTYNVVISMDEKRADVLGPDEAIYYRHYRVSYGSPPQWLGVGLADLYFRRVGINHEWKMVRWVDRRDTTAVTVRTIGRQRLGPPSVSP